MSAAGVRVLLAEDSPSDAEFILASLADHWNAGSIYVSPDGADALDFLFRRGTHAGRGLDAMLRLVVLDLKLPKISGLEVLREIKCDPVTRYLPVVMLTSSAMEADIALAYELGANSYVQKPVDFLHFRDTVRALTHYWLSVNETAPALGPVETP
jgi:two-component system response regulator